jgi:lipoprotein-anchoring transpeptidase ErfK/SrfK
MIRNHIIKIRKNILAPEKYFGGKRKLGVAAASAILICGAVLWLAMPLPQNYETEIPKRAKSYTAEIIACGYDPEKGAAIEIRFKPGQLALAELPEYKIEEITSQAKTRATFEDISRLDGDFDWAQIAANPMIDSIDYIIDGKILILDIYRRGPYLGAKAETSGSSLAIILPAAGEKNYPVISNQKPARESFAFPMRHTIAFEAVLRAPLATAMVFINEKPVSFRQEEIAPGEYRFSFEQDIEIDKEYTVKTIIGDRENRAAVDSWSFMGQIPSAAILGKDRFKYLGWWGQINANGVAVRQDASAFSEKLGTFSTANRVKVIKEVFGEWINGKNLWYQIDGGAYPEAYVFSEFVTPMAQPVAPENFTIPEEVAENEKWIDVDLAKKILTLLEYDRPVFSTYIAPGREENPTKTGTYRIWYKLVKAEMRGGPPLHSYVYHLKNIPWVMYYNYDYAIHGTYWHDKFGMPQSAGCTNMTQGDAKFIFENTLPALTEGQKEAFSRDKPNVGYGTGTVVYNHY